MPTPNTVPPREGRWLTKPKKPRVTFWSVYMGAHFLFVPARVVLTIQGATLLARTVTYGHALFLFGGLAVWGLNELRVRRRQRSDEALTERPQGLEEFPVEIIVRVNEQPLGMDRGVVYFDDGLMGFVGSSATFLLAAEDFERRKALTDLDVPFRPLDLANGAKSDVRIKPLLGHGRAFRRRLRRFLRDGEPAQGPRQWPPLTAYRTPQDDEEAETTNPIEVAPAAQDLLDQAELALRLGNHALYARLQEQARQAETVRG